MRTRSSTRSIVATFLGAVVLAGCSGPGTAPIPSSPVTAGEATTASTTAVASTTAAGPSVQASPASGALIPAAGFALHAPAGYVDVTERAAKTVLGWPLFAGNSLKLVWVGVDASDPGDLSKALVVAILATGPDPATAAGTLGARADGGGAASSAVDVAGQTWHTFPAAAGASAQLGLGALCRFAETNVVVAEGGSGAEVGAHPTLWSVAATLGRS